MAHHLAGRAGAVSMTHRERILATFRFQPTDHAAVDLMEAQVWPELMEWAGAERGITDVAALQAHLGADLCWCFMPCTPPPAPPAPPAATPAAPARKVYSAHVAAGPLAGATTVREVEEYPWPDPDWFQPVDCAAIRAQWPDHGLVFGPGWNPLFWNTCTVFGVEAALTHLAAEPALFEASIRCIHERHMERLRRGLPAAQGYADICHLGDDFSTQESMMLSPEHWRRYVKPALAEQVALIRSYGIDVLYHSCGAVRPVLGDLIDIGVNGLLVFQTNAKGMDVESIARDFGGRLVFYGGIEVQHLLSYGTPAEVRAAVLHNRRAFANCGGYAVANCHHQVATIQGPLLEAMFEAAREPL